MLHRLRWRASLGIWLGVAAICVVGCGEAGERQAIRRPSPGSKILFTGNFDTGNISPWLNIGGGAQCANYKTYTDNAHGELHIVTDRVAPGSKYAGRFDLPTNSSGKTSCEVLRPRREALGTDDWYAQEVYFPSDWREPSPTGYWGMLIGQYNYENLPGANVGPPVGLYAHSDHVNLGLQSGHCVLHGGCQYWTGNDWPPHFGLVNGTLGTTLRITPVGTRLAETWQQFVVHVHWAGDSSGLVQGWWRPLGGAWKRTVDFGGHPTVQWSDAQPLSATFRTVDKIGAYRGAASFPISVWQDGFCVATSFSAAASCL
jgi:hypothetical protein